MSCRLALKTAPSVLAVEEALVRDHARINTGVDDYLVRNYITAATAYLDGWAGILGRALMPQVWTMTLQAFPAGCITIPLGPVTAIAAITYKDAAGAAQVVPAGDYTLSAGTYDAAVNPVAGWPSAADLPDAVAVEFSAGTGCPEPVAMAIMMMVSAIYDGRQGEDMMTPAVRALLAPFIRPMS